MDYTNGDKSRHGKNAQNSIDIILKECQDNGYIKDYVVQYRIGKDGFNNQKQFYAPFLVEFNPDEKWIIFSTTSMRTDRIKGQQWDSINIKNIVPAVKKAYLVYSDDISQEDTIEFQRQNEKYVTKGEYSAIDQILSQDALYNLIEKTALTSLNSGQIKDMQGRKFEDRVATILSNQDNLKKYVTADKTITGINYPIFYNIVSSLDIEKENIVTINATTDPSVIGKLPTSGNPKTDVYVTIATTQGEKVITISCKRTSSKWVTVHEYTADAFSYVLDASNEHLKLLLHEFQQNPTLTTFGTTNQEALTKELRPYVNKLAKWVLAGVYGYGDPTKHWATHILTYDNNDGTTAFHTIDEYIDALQRNGITGHFGTFFTWTYPSKRRGKSIQLKCKIIK